MKLRFVVAVFFPPDNRQSGGPDISRNDPRHRHDPSGAVVARSDGEGSHVGTGLERTTTTSTDGSYSIPELPIGSYTVTVTQSGFQTAVTNNVK